MLDATTITTPEAELTVLKSHTPAIYVPRRFRIGGIEEIPLGAAIVGTPQGQGTVAIDVHATPYVDPSPQVWTTWAWEAAHRHVCTEEDLPDGEQMQTIFVSEHDLDEVGCYEHGRVLLNDDLAETRLSAWIEAGRAAHAGERPFPHEP